MRLLLVLCVLLSGGISTALAQSNEAAPANPVPSAVSATVEQAVPVANPLFVTDQVTRQQFISGASGSFQRINDLAGLGNAAQITQIGEGNVTVLQQYGGQNVASFVLEGDRNDVRATQDGVGNLLDVSVLGNDNRLPILQGGHDLALRFTLEASDIRLQNAIQQTGTGGMPIVIEHRPGATP